jgi:hypothetical protein
MVSALQFIATLSSALFAGAATYINLVEHPARMSCDTRTAATVWAPSYKRATVMQASLAILGFLAGGAVWLLGGSQMSGISQGQTSDLGTWGFTFII